MQDKNNNYCCANCGSKIELKRPHYQYCNECGYLGEALDTSKDGNKKRK